MKKIIFTFLTFVLFIINVEALVDPTSNFYVNDYANILSEETENEIQSMSVQLSNTDGTQMVVVTVEDLEGLSVEEYANQLFNKFGIGEADSDNGLLILVSRDDRKIRVEVGYGLEGVINDGKAGRYLDAYAVPYLKNNEWDKGIFNVYNALYKEIVTQNNLQLEYTEPTGELEESEDSIHVFMMFSLFIGYIIGTFIRATSFKEGGLKKIVILIGAVIVIFIVNFLIGLLANIIFAFALGIVFGIFGVSFSGSSSGGRGGGGGFRGGGGRSGGGGASRGF
ncbi:MAG: TPM domain-containing protein [Bacilli bacterium]|nr:TPM domain-containing protein [Bacilli bacterium]